MKKTNNQEVAIILVVGGTGFIGRHLLAALPDYFPGQTLQIRILTREAMSHPLIGMSGNAVYIQGDITQAASLKPAMEGVQYVFHLAGKTGIPKDRDEVKSFWQINLEGTRNLARIAAKSNVKVMMNLSSSSVYGDIPSQEIYETSPTNPIGLYGITKLAAEQAAETESAGSTMRIISVRPSNVFGENSSFNVLLTMMHGIKSRRFFLLRNSEQAVVNYVYVGDVVDAAIRLALTPDASGKFNVNTPKSILEFATMMAKALDTPAKFSYFPFSFSYALAALVEILSASVKRPPLITRDKIRTLVNTQMFSPKRLQGVLPDWPRYGLEDGINLLAKHYIEKGQL